MTQDIEQHTPTTDDVRRAWENDRRPWIGPEFIGPQFDRWLAERALEAWRAGFRAGWEASGEGHNGEWPDEGVPWPESSGYQNMRRAETALGEDDRG